MKATPALARLRAPAALTLLVTAASCAPVSPGRVRVSQLVPPATPRQLLRDLALDAAAPGSLPRSLVAGAGDDGDAGFADGAPAFLAAPRSDEDARRAAQCLTEAVYYEARSEPEDGQRAVAQVVLNRVRDRAFPHSVCGVVYQGSQRRTGCQFSFTCDGSMTAPRDPYAWARAARVAAAALAGHVYTPVGSATFYHANYVLPWWASSLTRIGSVGAHIFYRWRGAMEQALSFRASYTGVEPGIPAPGASAGDVGAQTAGLTPDASEGGVTVHRGGAGASLAATQADKPASLHRLMTTTTGGIRVHFGREAPDREVTTDGVTIGAESDPI